jgi:hypothetical protein
MYVGIMHFLSYTRQVYSTFEIRRSTPNLFLTWQKCDHASECEEEEEEEYIYKCIYVQKLNQTVLEQKYSEHNYLI